MFWSWFRMFARRQSISKLLNSFKKSAQSSEANFDDFIWKMMVFLTKSGASVVLELMSNFSYLVQVNNYEIVLNFFHISHNLTLYSAIVQKFTRIYPFVQLMNWQNNSCKMSWQPWGQVGKCWIHLASGGLGLMKFGI